MVCYSPLSREYLAFRGVCKIHQSRLGRRGCGKGHHGLCLRCTTENGGCTSGCHALVCLVSYTLRRPIPALLVVCDHLRRGRGRTRTSFWCTDRVRIGRRTAHEF